MQRSFKKRNDFSTSMSFMIVGMMTWTLMGLMLSQQMKTTDAVKFKGDNCQSKNHPGICREWGECPVIKTLIESGEYSNREVVSCGFGVREELICCPVVRTDTNVDTSTPETDRFVTPTTTQAPKKDFLDEFLANLKTSTTAAPDFWRDLLTTSTTTTMKPLVVGENRLNETAEFFDFNALLSGQQRDRNGKQERLTNTAPINANNSPNVGFFGTDNNEQRNLNQNGNNFNNGFGNGRGNSGRNQQNNGNGNIGRGQLNSQQNNGRGQNNGSGQNHGRGQMNGRGQNNNGARNSGFTFPENNVRPNQFIESEAPPPSRRPGRPVNNMMEQDPNNQNTNNNHENSKLAELIKKVFVTSPHTNANLLPNAPIADEKPREANLEDAIADIFHVTKQNPVNSQNPAEPVVWVTPLDNMHPIHPLGSQHQMEFINPQPMGHFEVIRAVENHLNTNDLEVVPATNFIQQPTVVETWSNKPIPNNQYDPFQGIHENLVNSGMSIVKGQVEELENVYEQQQQQFVHQPQFGQQLSQFVAVQPQQQPVAAQHFGQPQSQRLIQEPQQSESNGKEARSTHRLEQFPNVQSPPTKVLDPFKPFEFRPPPEDENIFSEDNNSLSPSPTPAKPTSVSSTERPAVRACRRIERGLAASLSQHILGGTPAELGEFPHMVAIGYSRIGGDNRPPYDIRCGGTLIDKRFVLTAAHCVSEIDSVPSIVRLGVVNFTDPVQMSQAVELRIKETFIHDNYSTRLTYNDIAILELEREVETGENIYPVCLYTNETDPNTNIKLWVTGWGTINTTTRSFSNILLKAPLHTSPLENCNQSFTEYGLNRRIPDGIIRTQICAEDKDQIKDACQGDSGGPLNLVVDESFKNYRLVGVVSSGFGCASSTPGLYTRVAAFLDFIEKIVWPNGGD